MPARAGGGGTWAVGMATSSRSGMEMGMRTMAAAIAWAAGSSISASSEGIQAAAGAEVEAARAVKEWGRLRCGGGGGGRDWMG